MRSPSTRAQREQSESRSEEPWGWGPAALIEVLFELEEDRARVFSKWRIGVELYGHVEGLDAFSKFLRR